MKVDVAAISDTGRVREGNEDSFLVDMDLFVFAVADGMGGHVAGEIASATAIEAIRASAASGSGIENAIRNAHTAVKKKSASEEALAGMGTTLTAMGFSSNKELVIAHVGDSRAYVLHRQLMDDVAENSETELVRITKDHSLVEELVDAGEITEEEANVHPRRSVITRALGIEGDVDVDTTPIPFLKGDRYLLCSDGLTSMVRDDEIGQVLRAEKSPNDAARELVSRANQAGGNDNITVVIIDVYDPDVHAPVMATVAQSISADEPRASLHDKKGKVAFGVRIAVCTLAIAGLLFGAYATAKHFAQNGYFLDQRHGHVVLMTGQYGGVLWWNPELNTQTGLDVKNLSSADKLLVSRHARFSSRSQAIERVEQMQSREVKNSANTDSTTTPPTAPTTSVVIPPPTSVSSD